MYFGFVIHVPANRLYSMSYITKVINTVVSCLSAEKFYSGMNNAYKKFHNQYYMLHYPFYQNDEDDFFQSQKNLTNHCLSKISPIKGKTVLDIGCGNGIQGLHISQDHKPGKYIGIDISPGNIKIAQELLGKNDSENMIFHVDNAQDLANIQDNSIDVVINIESALHYPDKIKFLREVNRVLKPGGEFMIADVLTKKKQNGTDQIRKKRWGIFHHWTLEQYHQSFHFADLRLTSSDDISQSIQRGFANYRKWFRGIRVNGALKRWVSNLFVFLNAKIYSYMYARNRSYYIFAGIKTLPGRLL